MKNPPHEGRCLCGGPSQGYSGPVQENPGDLLYRGGGEWQCPRCFGWFEPEPEALKSFSEAVKGLKARHPDPVFREKTHPDLQ
jgi:hypothetical protein